MSLPSKPKIVAKQIRKLTGLRPTLAIQLGSGFKRFAKSVKVDVEIPYSKLAGFPEAQVPGHEGSLILGKVAGVQVAVLCGRAHFYEGHSMRDITFPVRALAAFGIETLLLTNAAGGVNPRFKTGEFMQLSDHINMMGRNPLRGVLGKDGPPFLDLSQVYDPKLNFVLANAARKVGLKLHVGVYMAVSGPTYETPAEVRAFKALGADALGMSTVPEAIVARHCGMRVAGVSCITNAACSSADQKVSHEEVLEVGDKSAKIAASFLEEFVRLYERG
ncbi:MAG: purine-nucleoside phosphorylase [Verrucomicrobiia bacterium]